ncbi:uncharacterized protein SPPG_08516 [Spizellomyces punctatus DAOM BR117]|uniref:Amino acid permease/ SLC12A domain-containing protein n=1 Tax=Spizellomyces punctatus (strain DAOM BR117) TaxID=645134 RepID=A0A0L0H593_SPIPD|nr:uncharacterized protein SPPG_08516 [Spizellomyces punctatus DAOM BR117]KNC96129.1 hypothetical protein SPPG_08516 [Spizellomyces punctatus DAOM BR117]|eukprot:XP_016604169.1 hypothetical protein SPPG_08516 [Spizellomyces punctatus DAOM BR117]
MSKEDSDYVTFVEEDGRRDSGENKLEQGLKREMKARHIAMISIGGTIGTGLFVASGGAIAKAGPAGALLAYAFMGFTVFCIMTALGEMATLIPVSGSFNHYASRFVDPALGFALGWNYWLSWAITIASELAAAGLIIGFWKEIMPTYIWALILLAIIVVFNMFGGKGYGETEYWLSFIKIVTVIIFILVAILVAAGAVGGTTYGFKNWRDPGAFNSGAPFNNGFANVLSVMLVVGFSYMGTELVGIAAGETANPRKAVPVAIRNVFWRILLFFLCCIFLIGLIIPYTDPNLLDAAADGNNAAIAPFTIVFQRANIGAAANIMNAVLLTVIISASNSALFCGSRTLMALSREGKAPRIFSWVNRWGVPIPAVAATSVFGISVAAASVYGSAEVFSWVLGFSAVTGFISWAGIGFTHYRFRKAYVAQGRDVSRLPYIAWAFPFSSLFGGFVCAAITLASGFEAFTPTFSVVTFFRSYINIVLFIVLWVGYKLIMKTKVVPLLECDFDTGIRWLDNEPEEKTVEPDTLGGKVKYRGKRFLQQFIA